MSEVPKESPPEVVVSVSQTQPAKKPVKLNKWHIITVVLVAVICLQAALYMSLMANYGSLESEYNVLLSEHATLEGDYSSLQSSYDSFRSSYGYLRDQVNKRTLGSDVKSFITPQDSLVRSKVLQITGGWTSTSDWNEFWTDVKSMYDWVASNIDYRYDGLFPTLPSSPSGSVHYDAEMWQLPSETLDLLKGDCEDMAILLTSMIHCYGGQSFGGAECIVIEGSLAAHVGVQLPVSGGKLTILDPAGNYYTQTWYGSVTSNAISVEINNWLNYWMPEMGSSVHVSRVFSDDIERSFYSTSEYTTWMYSR